ncbi:KRAB-A domain containing hypothetical protein [Phytophthora palmivora]|uniref:Uncharacterized protein n=1 Tax=Phytophthora palmivora TaxID=4796 RepID=A0A2P4XBF0_9STRA|nr:KRAB-A domain containing hypothetical protein [Phytophthora palmivora]
MSDLVNDASENQNTVLVGENRPTSSHEPTNQLSISPVDVFELNQERGIDGSKLFKSDVQARRVNLKARAAHARTSKVPYYVVVGQMFGRLTWVSLRPKTELGYMRTGTFGRGLSKNMSESAALVVVERIFSQGEIQSSRGCFFKIYLDRFHMGPLTTKPRGNKFILVFADYFTRWVETFPIKRRDTVIFAETR